MKIADTSQRQSSSLTRRTPADPGACLAIGDDFLARGAALALLVPSVIVPQERNALINVRHPDMPRVRPVGDEAFRLDPRLLSPAR
jgi:RES domain-containing protein